MDHKTFTFLITSNRNGKTRALTISASWIKASLALLIIFGVILSAAVVDYTGLLLKANENKRLHAENSSLRQQFEVIESKVVTLENSIERVKNYSKKLKLITDVEGQDRSTKLAMGVTPKPGQPLNALAEQWGDRQPSSEFLQKENIFMKRPPLDEARKELVRESQKDYGLLSIRIDRVVRETELREQGVIELWETLAERQSLLNATPSIKPARGWFTSRFGYRIDPFTNRPLMHNGLDLAAPPGTPVYAPADGVISYVGYESGYGKLVTVDHGYGVKTRYAHNSQIYVELGQRVKRWDVISAVGSTGRSSGPHLHYEIRVHGVPVDPINYILDE